MTFIVAIFCIIIAVCTTILGFLLSVASSRWAKRYGAVDQPTGGRKIHTSPIPLWGGIGIGLTILIAISLMVTNGVFQNTHLFKQLVGFLGGVIILMIGGAIDDRWPLPPGFQFVFPVCAALMILFTGTSIGYVTSLAGPQAFSLVWWTGTPWNFHLPADLITVAWLLFAMYSTKFLDGLDGLVTGMTVIGSMMMSALTLLSKYYQPDIALLTSAIGGAFLGFLPRNIHPAKQFLGESGSLLAGFTLGFLGIVSGAKIAITLSVLAIPLADAMIVVIGRLRRGASPFRGDDTHLHFRLLRAGIPHRTAVFLLWGISLAAGGIALLLQTRGKIFLIATLMTVTALTSWFMEKRGKRA